MYDQEQDIDYMEGSFVADFRYLYTMLIFSGSIFSAKAVAPNEVIHVNPRETHLVFKVQAYSSKSTHSLVEVRSIANISGNQNQ